MQTKLTVALIRNLTEGSPPAHDASYFDTALPRFAIRVKPPVKAGAPWASLYYVRYTADGRERRIKVGNPKTMSLDDARASARAVLGRVDSGRDPAAETAARRAAWTTAEAWREYEASPEFARKSPRTKVDDAAAATLHVLRHLGSAKLGDIDVPAVRRLYRAVASDQRSNRRRRRLGGPAAARRAVRTLSTLMTWCVADGHLSRNPILGALRLPGGGERTVIMDTPEQYAALFETMDQMVAEGRLRPAVRAFVTLLAATGLRRNEARTLCWGDVDLETRRIVLRGTKGSKLRQVARLETASLPLIAAAALADMRPEDALPDDQVFPPNRGNLLAVNRDWNVIRKEACLPAGLVLHSLRHSIGTAGIIAGLSTAEVSKMLRHTNISVTQRYVHLAEASLARFQDRATEHLMPPPRQEGERR
jgi:integrase